MNIPKVSIIVPCYKQAHFLDECLQSVMNQTYQNWECIIVNDGSTDNSEQVANGWLAKDARFVYLYKENGGLSSARNAGITIAEGEFILPLDADDKIGKNYLKLAIDEFQKDKTLKVVYCKAEKFGEESGLWQLAPFSIYDLGVFNMIFCSAFFRKKDWKQVGGYDINMIYGLEDWEFWISILKNGGGVKCIDEVNFFYRVRAFSMARNINAEEREILVKYVAKKHIDFYLENFYELNSDRKMMHYKLKSEKYVINLFTKMFFKFNIFKEINSK